MDTNVSFPCQQIAGTAGHAPPSSALQPPRAVPCFAMLEAPRLPRPGRRRQPWDACCTQILRDLAESRSNREIADAIASATGRHFDVTVISRHRSLLGVHPQRANRHSAALTRARVIDRGGVLGANCGFRPLSPPRRRDA